MFRPFPHHMSALETTALLLSAREGDARAADALFERVYDELRRLSQSKLNEEPGAVTLSATGLVHESYLKLIHQGDWTDRAHFMAVAARAMRQILTDRARARAAYKRGGTDRAATLAHEPSVLVGDDQTDALADVLAVDAALTRLMSRDPELGRLVELRFFAGMTNAEAADVLGVTPRTTARMWARAKAHLRVSLD